MKNIQELTSTMPQVGRIEWIGIRPLKRGDVQEVDRIEVTTAAGITGDHYSKSGGKRMVTLIQKEHIQAVSQILRKEVSPDELRRNIVVSGINLLALHDQRFRVGSMILKGTGYCHPCSRMEDNLGKGGYHAMRGHGGITAVVEESGEAKLGDEVQYIAVVKEA